MKNLKTKTMALLGLVLATACLPSCGSKSYGESYAVYDGSEVTIKLYTTQSAATLAPITDAAIAAFNEMYPNIHVEHTQPGSYDDVRDQIKTEISVGEQPNIAYCYSDHVALYNKAKAVQTLDAFIDSKDKVTDALGVEHEYGFSKETKADFIEGYYNEGKDFGDGKMYCLPFSKSTEVLYYNATFFAQNSLSVPTTWAEFETVAAQIKQIDPSAVPLGYDSESNWFITLCEQYGCDYTSASGEGLEHFKFDNAKTREFMEKIKTWYSNGWVETQKTFGSYTSGLFTETGYTDDTKTTRSKYCVMCVGSSAGANHQVPSKVGEEYPFEVGITSIPQVDVSKPKTISQGASLCVFRSDNPQEVAASWLLVKYLTTDVAYQATFSLASGYLPPIKSVQENEAYKAKAALTGNENLPAVAMTYCISHSDMYFTSPAFVGSSEARDQVGTLLVSIMTGDKTADDAFKSALEECEQSVLD